METPTTFEQPSPQVQAYHAFCQLERKDPAGDHHEDFDAAYVGSWRSMAIFAEAFTDSMGWTHSLDELATKAGIPAGMLTWDQHILTAHLRDTYDIVETSGWCHVFER